MIHSTHLIKQESPTIRWPFLKSKRNRPIQGRRNRALWKENHEDPKERLPRNFRMKNIKVSNIMPVFLLSKLSDDVSSFYHMRLFGFLLVCTPITTLQNRMDEFSLSGDVIWLPYRRVFGTSGLTCAHGQDVAYMHKATRKKVRLSIYVRIKAIFLHWLLAEVGTRICLWTKRIGIFHMQHKQNTSWLQWMQEAKVFTTVKKNKDDFIWSNLMKLYN